MSKELIIGIYTILIIIALLRELEIRIRNSKINEYNTYINSSEYLKAIQLLEKDKKRTIFGLEHKNTLIYMYFLTNNFDKYINAKKNYININLNYLFKITESIFMYLHEEIDNANIAYNELVQNSNDIDKKIYYDDYKTWILFQILKMIYSYHNGNYNETKKMYESISTYAYNATFKTLISYYMCKIYEHESKTELINKIVSDNEIQNNYFGYYLDKWRNE